MNALDNFDNIFDDAGIEVEDTSDTNEKIYSECEEAGIEIAKPIKEEQHQIFYGLTALDRQQAAYEFIVPDAYKNSTFDVDKIKDNLRAQYSRDSTVKIYKFPDYEEVCNGILSSIRMKKIPTRSYLIGAPNGFGKSSFVYESLITLRRQGYKVAPYISLWELAQLRVENEQKILAPFKRYKDALSEDSVYKYTEPNKVIGYSKGPEIVTGRYSYSEYINSDCLFVSFTDAISKDIESHTLYQLLNIRGAKGLPTIAMISTALEPYLNDRDLKEIVWDEILTHSEQEYCYDRVLHVSCYKRRDWTKLNSKGSTVESDTGIVH